MSDKVPTNSFNALASSWQNITQATPEPRKQRKISPNKSGSTAKSGSQVLADYFKKNQL